MKRTSRGFKIYGEFEDRQAQEIRVQESSAIGTPPRAWVFTNNREENNAIIHLGKPMGLSPYLSIGDARKLVKALQRFIDQK